MVWQFFEPLLLWANENQPHKSQMQDVVVCTRSDKVPNLELIPLSDLEQRSPTPGPNQCISFV